MKDNLLWRKKNREYDCSFKDRKEMKKKQKKGIKIFSENKK